MDAHIGDLGQPLARLMVDVVQVAEFSEGPEALAQIYPATRTRWRGGMRRRTRARMRATFITTTLENRGIAGGDPEDGRPSRSARADGDMTETLYSCVQVIEIKSQNLVLRCPALILTALPVEYQAVRARLSNVREDVHPNGTVYEIGDFVAADGRSWTVCIGEIGAGNEGAAMEAERAIRHFDAKIALFVGVAGGLKDVAIGDTALARHKDSSRQW